MDAAVVAYPVLLAACYGIHLIGLRRKPSRLGAFDALQLGTEGILLGVTLAITVRFVSTGRLSGEWGGIAAACAVVGLAGIISVDAHRALRRARNAQTST